MAIGSCVVVVAYDRYKKVGGLAHAMLPGRSPNGASKNRTKYAEDIVDILLNALKKAGANIEDSEVTLVGGANVLGVGNISEQITGSVLNYLKRLNIKPKKKKLGGTQRRSVSLDIDSGKMFYSEGDGMGGEL